jgi:hypothetical protein
VFLQILSALCKICTINLFDILLPYHAEEFEEMTTRRVRQVTHPVRRKQHPTTSKRGEKASLEQRPPPREQPCDTASRTIPSCPHSVQAECFCLVFFCPREKPSGTDAGDLGRDLHAEDPSTQPRTTTATAERPSDTTPLTTKSPLATQGTP